MPGQTWVYIIIYLCAFALAFLVTRFFTPVVIKVASQFGLYDMPNSRKVHQKALPRLGGLAIFAGFVFSIHFAMLLPQITPIKFNMENFIGILLGALIMVAIGTLDDVKARSPLVKLFWQIIAALTAFAFGIGINFVSNPFGGLVPIQFALSLVLSVIWITGITNAINLIDGLDGLASGVCFIASITLFFVALRTHQIEAAFVLLALSGACLAFLRFNFFPAKIFLGDSGSLLLGFILASASIVGVLKTTLVVALGIPVLVLGIPIYDTITSILRRLWQRKHIFMADNRHLHHRLLTEGLNQKESVLAIYSACLVLAAMALVITWVNAYQAVFIFIISIFLALAVFISIKKRMKTRKGLPL